MAKTASLNLRVSEDLKAKLTRFATETDRTPSAVAERALGTFLDYHLEMLEAVEQSREDFRQGRTVPHEVVMAEIDALLKARRDRSA